MCLSSVSAPKQQNNLPNDVTMKASVMVAMMATSRSHCGGVNDAHENYNVPKYLSLLEQIAPSCGPSDAFSFGRSWCWWFEEEKIPSTYLVAVIPVNGEKLKRFSGGNGKTLSNETKIKKNDVSAVPRKKIKRRRRRPIVNDDGGDDDDDENTAIELKINILY